MNNDTTPNTTRHYYMGTYSIGGHLWNAGEAYMEMAEKLADAGSLEFAGQFVRQAEEAYCWANALQAGSIVESLEDLVGVRIDRMDAWIPTERVAMMNARVRGESLPVSPSHEHVELGSPENVSRETYDCTGQPFAASTPPPLSASPSADNEGMDTHTTTATAISDLVAQFVAIIVAQVTEAMSSEMESIAENVFESKDIAEEVTESYDFSSAVESIISDYDFSDKVRDTLGDITFTVSVD